jgi:hypothetical protein
VNLGTNSLEAAQQLCVVIERQVRIEAVDDVQFGERLVGAASKLVPRLFERHRIGRSIRRLKARKRAEQAARDADVGRLETQVVVEVGARAVALLAFAVGQRSDRKQIGALNSATPSSSVRRSLTRSFPSIAASPAALMRAFTGSKKFYVL